MAAALLVACSLAVSGCSDKKTEEPVPPAVSYRVVDLETLVKAHPKYSTYFRLETEYNHLLDQYQNERNKLIHIASQQQHIKARPAGVYARAGSGRASTDNDKFMLLHGIRQILVFQGALPLPLRFPAADIRQTHQAGRGTPILNEK